MRKTQCKETIIRNTLLFLAPVLAAGGLLVAMNAAEDAPFPAELIRHQQAKLGHFSEIQEDLRPDRIIQDILKKNPDHFETLLK